MNPQLITKRIGAVDSSTASIVGTAAWCSLHASDSNAIVSAITSRLQQPLDVVPIPIKCSLLFVLHEMLLACAMQGVSETGKQLLCAAISAKLPDTIRKVVSSSIAAVNKESANQSSAAGGSGGDIAEFQQAVLRVTAWWVQLNLISKDKLKEIRQPVIAQAKAASVALSAGASHAQGGAAAVGVVAPSLTSSTSLVNKHIPAQLQGVARLWQKYEGARETLEKLSNSNASTKEALDGAREEVIRRLVVLIKAIDGRDEQENPGAGSNTLGVLAKLHEDLAALQSSASGAPAVLDEKDDILGSFF